MKARFSAVFRAVAGRRRVQPRLISWWWVLWALIAVALAIWGSTTWLLAQTTSTGAALRIEAIKTGLSVGAGIGGVVALLLAVRRQWLGERAQVHTEEDARERRITELYTKAADQLGNERAPVRLAGLYALERLAQNNEDHRQTIVNVICAYLRMPFIHPWARTETDPEAEEELQVRMAAQTILTGHLRPHLVYSPDEDNDVPGPSFWADIQVDLSGAVLANFDFSNCRARLPDFSSAYFYGNATFSYCRTLALVLDGAIFHGNAYFHDAVIDGGAFFDGAVFHGYVNLSNIDFVGDQARFPGAHFHGNVSIIEANFHGSTRFDGATFNGDVTFLRSTFHAGVWFGDWTEEATYHPSVAGGDATFGGKLSFDEVIVLDPAGPNIWPQGWRIASNGTTATLEQTAPHGGTGP